MDILDAIIENLELERELGTRTVEIDRAFLVPPPEEPPPMPAGQPAPPKEVGACRQSSGRTSCDIMFISGRPLSADGVDAIRKTIDAMKRIRPDVIAILNGDATAKILILLGADALKGRTAAARPVRGRWMTVDGVPAMPTFSPDYIFTHFQKDSPGMKMAKRDMWEDVKTALARLTVH